MKGIVLKVAFRLRIRDFEALFCRSCSLTLPKESHRGTKKARYFRSIFDKILSVLERVDDTEVISFLLSIEIIPLCLHTMETGIELPKTVATSIVLLDDVGLNYICTTAEHFFAVGREHGGSSFRATLIVCVGAYHSMLTFNNCLREDPITRRWLR
ncbi:hypothetical protein VNO77_04273 [Canavalia gladiata]|uniref:Uncharacterized protein n=1 Tax=Canavalia gladiata TaxID=3824 RepID=A0AAN9N1W6_CANGL